MMANYAFYDEDIRQQFIEAINPFGLSYELGKRQDELLVTLTDKHDLDTELEIDAIYNRLMDGGLDLWADAGGTGIETNSAGVRVLLKSGEACQIRFDTAMMNKLLKCLTPQELEDLVQEIALAVETPTDKPLCEL